MNERDAGVEGRGDAGVEGRGDAGVDRGGVEAGAATAPGHWVADELGCDESYGAWLAELDGDGAPADETLLPAPDDAAALLRRLGCPESAVTATVTTLPDASSDPARWWLLERCRARLVRDLGDPGASRGLWPQLPPRLGAAGGAFYLHLFLATMPATLRYHEDRDVPEDVSWATLADLGRHVALYGATHGATGVDEPWWMTLHLRGILYEIGRLQYSVFRLGEGPEHPKPWYDDSDAALLGPGFRAGDETLGIHIPAGGPLTPDACAASYRRARHVIDASFPVPGRRVATCSTWLLDDQLDEYLPPESNILAFRRSFQLVPGWVEGDRNVMTFVFRTHDTPLDKLPRDTRMQRAVVSHLSGGRHFHWRTGWLDLPRA